jgi:hypothetical protein
MLFIIQQEWIASLMTSQTPSPSDKPGAIGSRLGVLAASLILYLIACALPALYLAGDRTQTMRGVEVLALGWQGLLIGQFAWFANGPWLISLFLVWFRRPLTAAVLAFLAFALAQDTWRLFGQEIPADEGGVNQFYLERLGPGAYLWMASIALVVVGALVIRLRSGATRQPATYIPKEPA